VESVTLSVCVSAGGEVQVSTSAGWLDARERASLRSALDTMRPILLRASAPPLPPRDAWPELWREAWSEREAIAAEGGGP